jgi:hypothetical protein
LLIWKRFGRVVINKLVVLLSFALLFSSNVSAALVDNDTYTTDAVSGLHWLDLTATADMSMFDAEAAYDGWRLATNSEVEDLFGQLFDGYYDTSANGYSSSSDGAYADQSQDVAAFHALFGLNAATSLHQTTYGFYFDEDNLIRAMGANLRLSSSVTNILGLEHTSSYPNYDDTFTSVSHGTYLVYASSGTPGSTSPVVPIPAAVWLFGSALAGLGWFRRTNGAS